MLGYASEVLAVLATRNSKGKYLTKSNQRGKAEKAKIVFGIVFDEVF